LVFVDVENRRQELRTGRIVVFQSNNTDGKSSGCGSQQGDSEDIKRSEIGSNHWPGCSGTRCRRDHALINDVDFGIRLPIFIEEHVAVVVIILSAYDNGV